MQDTSLVTHPQNSSYAAILAMFVVVVFMFLWARKMYRRGQSQKDFRAQQDTGFVKKP